MISQDPSLTAEDPRLMAEAPRPTTAATETTDEEHATPLANQLRLNFAYSLDADADYEAQLQRIAAQTGVPIDSARAYPKEAKRQAMLSSWDFDHLAQHFPQTAAFYRDLDHTRMAHDDMSSLTLVEQGLRALHTTYQSAPHWRDWFQQARAGTAAWPTWLRTLAFDLPAQFDQGVADTFALGFAPEMVDAPSGGAEKVARGAGQITGFMSGLPLKVIKMGLEGLQMLKVLPTDSLFKALLKDVSRNAVTLGLTSGVIATGQVLQAPTPNEGLARLEQEIIGGAALGGLFGAAGRLLPENTLTQLVGRIAAVNIGVDALSGTRPWDKRSLIEKTFHYGLNTIFSLPGAGRTQGGWFRDAVRAHLAQSDAQAVQQTMQAASASKLRTRAPEAFKQFIAQASEDSPIQEVYIDVQPFTQALAQAGLSAEQLAQTMPEVAAQLPEAQASSGMVRIPITDLTTHLAGPELAPLILPHLRTDPEGMTQAEAQHFYQTQVEQLQQEAERVLQEHQQAEAQQQSAQVVYDHLLEQLNDTKRFAPTVNQAYAALHRAFYETLAARTGETPEALYQRYPLRVTAEQPAGEHVMRQANEPVVTLHGEEIAPKEVDLKVLRAAAKDYYAQHLEGQTVNHPGLGAIEFTKRGLRKALWTSANPLKLRLFAALPDILEKGELIRTQENIHAQTHPNIKRYHWIRGKVTIDDEPVSVDVNVEEHANGKLYYNHTLPGREYFQEKDAQTENLANSGVPLTAERPAPLRRALPKTDSQSPAPSIDRSEDNLNLLLHRQGEAGQRGQIAFGEDLARTPSVITLLQEADLSTFLHESGHFFLEVMHDITRRAEAPEGLKQDMQTLLNWLGVRDIDAWQSLSAEAKRPYHEQFARGFEAYLFEGKAPTLEMRGLFRRFRAWLLTVYRHLRNLNVPLTEEVRGVFDRMLASEEAIQATEAVRHATPLFTSAERAGLSPEEWQDYQALGAEATAEAIEQLQARSLRDMRWLSRAKSRELKRLQQAVKDKRQQVTAEVQAELSQQPVYRALKFLKHGELTGEATLPESLRKLTSAGQAKLSLPALKQMYGVEADALWRRLPTGQYGLVANEGLHPDDAAPLFGYQSGDAMVQALLKAPPLKEAIASLTDQRLLARYGELTDPEQLSRAADEAVHNEARARCVATELKALTRATGSVQLLTRAAKAAAQRAIAAKRLRDLKPTQYTAAEARAAKRASVALAKNDLVEAAAAKRDQLLNNQLAKAAMEARVAVSKAQAAFKRFGKKRVRRAVGSEAMAQIAALLERFDLRPAKAPLVADKPALASWADAQAKQGYEIAIAPALLNEANRQPFTEMTVGAWHDLREAVQNLAYIGRDQQKLRLGEQRRTLAEWVAEAARQSATLPQRQPPRARNPGEGGTGWDKLAAQWRTASSWVRLMDASLLKPEQLFDWLDQYDSNGVFNRVFRQIAEADVYEREQRAKIVKQLRALSGSIPKQALQNWDVRYELPELIDSHTGQASSMLKREIIAIALNTGNDSNFQKMLAGEGWQAEAVQAALDRHLTQADWEFVQGIWDITGSLWPQIEALQKRVSGLTPPAIQARTVHTRFGTYRGGYYPAIYDPLRTVEAVAPHAPRNSLFGEGYTRATTPKGHTIARQENYAAPLYLSLNAIPRHLLQVIHDLAYREAVMQAERFLTHPHIRRLIETTLGREYYQQFRPWLYAIANDKVYDSRGLAFWEKAAHWARVNTVIVGIGYRISTMLLHGATAFSNSIGEIGRWIIVGAQAFFGTPAKMRAARDFVFARSGEMRYRMQEVDRDIREQLQEMALRQATGPMSRARRGLYAVRRFAFYGVAMLDMASAFPTWIGAYHRARATGMQEADAIYAADKAVRNAHGGNGVKDLAAIQRGSEFQKLFTMFYSFWNHFYNRQRDIGRRARRGFRALRAGDLPRAKEDFALVLARSWFYFVIPTLLHDALSASSQSKDDDTHPAQHFAQELALGMPKGIPIVRDVVNAYHTGHAYTAIPPARMVTTSLQSLQDLSHELQGEDVSDQALKHALETTGYVFGLPTGQLATSGQFLWDVMDAQQDPEDLADWWRGLVYGHAQP